MSAAQHTPGPNPCRYAPKNETLRKTFAWFMTHGQESRVSRQAGGMSNAYCVARDTGTIPSWVPSGTPAFAAAKAGLCRRAAIAKATGRAA